jgi:biopolymer transport protein ExbD
VGLGGVPQKRSAEEDGDEGVFAEINITPLTDIFLVLLIIFMVTSSVIVNQGQGAQGGLKVNLPKGGQSDMTPQEKDLSVSVLVDGRLAMNGTVVTLVELEKVFRETQSKTPEVVVVIQADEGVPHGKVVEVMNLAKKTGLAKLAIGVRDRR